MSGSVRHRRIHAARASFAALLLLLVVFQAGAQEPTLAGRFTVDVAASDDIGAAINRAISGMNFVTRPIARSRLRSTNPIGEAASIQLRPDEVTITFQGGAPMVSPLDGRFVPWRREDGEHFELSTRWDGPLLVQRIRAPEGVRTTRYMLSDRGNTVTMRISVESPRLPRALEYDVIYRRAS
jgi:hypothetical protein